MPSNNADSAKYSPYFAGVFFNRVSVLGTQRVGNAEPPRCTRTYKSKDDSQNDGSEKYEWRLYWDSQRLFVALLPCFAAEELRDVTLNLVIHASCFLQPVNETTGISRTSNYYHFHGFIILCTICSQHWMSHFTFLSMHNILRQISMRFEAWGYFETHSWEWSCLLGAASPRIRLRTFMGCSVSESPLLLAKKMQHGFGGGTVLDWCGVPYQCGKPGPPDPIPALDVRRPSSAPPFSLVSIR